MEHNNIAQSVITFIDLVNSAAYAERKELEEYNALIREFHEIASNTFEEYSRLEQLDESCCYHRVQGDEIMLIFHGFERCTCLKHILNLVILLRENWFKSGFNTKRIDEGHSPLDIRAGIGEGKIKFEQSIWSQGVTPEGFPLTQTKRIESSADHITESSKGTDEPLLTPNPKILIKASLSDCIDKLNLQIELYPLTTFQPKGIDSVDVIPVKSYERLHTRLTGLLKEKLHFPSLMSAGISALTSGSYEVAASHFKKALAMKQDSFDVNHYLGGCLGYLGQFEKAKEYLERAIELNPESSAAYNTYANALWRRNEKNKAIKMLEKAIELDPNNYGAYMNLGSSYSALGDWSKAEDCYQKALLLSPNSHILHYNIGTSYFSMRRYHDAIKHFREAIRISSTYTEAHTNLSSSLNSIGMYSEAEMEARIALKFGPMHFEAIGNLAEVLRRQEKYDEAIQYFQRAEIMRPNDYKLLTNYAICLRHSKRYDEAKNYYIRSLDIEPNNSVAYVGLGIIAGEQGDLRESERLLRKAIEIDPNNHEAHYNLSVTLKKQGNIYEASKEKRIADSLHSGQISSTT